MKPKKYGPFTYCFSFDEPGLTFDSGATFDSTSSNAVHRHQLNQEAFPTSGISTTPHLERAIFYARGKELSAGYVFKIDRAALSSQNVKEYIVSEYSNTPSVPEDDEVILVINDAMYLPHAVILEIIKIPI